MLMGQAYTDVLTPHEQQALQASCDILIDSIFEDTDFEFLYDDSYDGIEKTELAQIMSISSLAFKDWFSPFSNEPSRTPHPYVLEDDLPRN